MKVRQIVFSCMVKSCRRAGRQVYRWVNAWVAWFRLLPGAVGLLTRHAAFRKMARRALPLLACAALLAGLPPHGAAPYTKDPSGASPGEAGLSYGPIHFAGNGMPETELQSGGMLASAQHGTGKRQQAGDGSARRKDRFASGRRFLRFRSSVCRWVGV